MSCEAFKDVRVFLLSCTQVLSSVDYDNHNSVSQYSSSARVGRWNQNYLEPRNDNVYQIAAQVPELISNSVSAVKNFPYVEVLRLVENFLRLKGRIANFLWQLWNDNAHIITAIQTTIIKLIPTIHNFTLSAIVILRKTIEFVSKLVNSGNAGVWA